MSTGKKTVHISIWGSGSGSNAQSIIDYFRAKPEIKISLIVSDNPEAYLLERGRKEQIPVSILNVEQRKNPEFLISLVHDYQVDLIVLAGYLRKMNSVFLDTFEGQVLNIHPALLPAYGGKGMYGHFVHEAVIRNQEKTSGITIHFVDGEYDRGEIIFQESLEIGEGWDATKLASEVLKLEHKKYPEIVEDICKKISHSH